MIVDTRKDLNVYKGMVQDPKNDQGEMCCQSKSLSCCGTLKPAELAAGALLDFDFNEWAGEFRASYFHLSRLILALGSFQIYALKP